MSSLQKFHRRTNNVPSGPVTWPATAIGGGDITHGFWLGDISSNKLIVAPKSTEVSRTWGSSGTARGTISASNGEFNTTTLFGFGSAAHPAAYYCRALTTGGYNTWYLPAKDELMTMYSNKDATPFVTDNSFPFDAFLSSTENNSTTVWILGLGNAYKGSFQKTGSYMLRAVRRTAV